MNESDDRGPAPQAAGDGQESSEAEPTPSASAPAEPEPSPEVDKLKKDLGQTRSLLREREAELEASQAMSRQTIERLKETHDRALRAAADLENYKKRANRERDEVLHFGQEKLLRELLPVLDNLDRALAADAKADPNALLSGVQMTRKLFESTLAKSGVKGFTSLGQKFDPNQHEAMQSVESKEAPGTIVQELVRGYTLHGRLMRPAMVVVAKGAEAQETTPAATKQASADEAQAEAPAAQPKDTSETDEPEA